MKDWYDVEIIYIGDSTSIEYTDVTDYTLTYNGVIKLHTMTDIYIVPLRNVKQIKMERKPFDDDSDTMGEFTDPAGSQ